MHKGFAKGPCNNRPQGGRPCIQRQALHQSVIPNNLFVSQEADGGLFGKVKTSPLQGILYSNNQNTPCHVQTTE